jgi:hypothetical protein
LSKTYTFSFSAGHGVAVARPVILFFILLCGPVAPALAVNIYDVVELTRRGYSEKEIVGIIDATESVFELTSEDIQGLKNLGISLPVIEAMMKRSGSPDQNNRGPAIDPLESLVPPEARSDTYAAPTAAVRAPFSINLVREEATGGHHHISVELYGAQLLILRDEGRYPSLEDRARAIALSLDKAKQLGPGEFQAVHSGGKDTVIFRSAGGAGDVSIVTVSASDAIAYDVRSERRVTTDLLAMYWSALLSDYWTIVFQREAPERLRHLHRGEALMLLYSVIRNMPMDKDFSLDRGVRRLPQSIQQHLARLAYAVPDDFDESDE